MHRVILNDHRIDALAKVFKQLGLSKVKQLELIDPQMDAARIIKNKCGIRAPVLLFLNALVSYMLTIRGEEYWIKYAYSIPYRCPEDWIDILALVEDFTSKYNRYSLGNKLSRLRILKKCRALEHFIHNRDYKRLWVKTARCLNTDPNTKTIVFAIKMTYYGHRVNGFDDTLPMEIPLPTYRRVALITVLSGIIVVENAKSFYEESRILMRKTDYVRKAWKSISDYSGIPPLHLDVVLWLMGRYADAGSRYEIFSELKKNNRLLRIISSSLLHDLVDELFYVFTPR